MKKEIKPASPFKMRLLQFMKTVNLGQTKFEEETGLSRGAINKISDSMKDPSINKIKARFPELNVNWLKTGAGQMLDADEVVSSASYNDIVLAVLVDEIASLKATAKGSLFVDERDAIMSKIRRVGNF